MVKESVNGIRRATLFRETFNSFDSIKKNGGEATDVDLSNGVATSSKSDFDSFILYPEKIEWLQEGTIRFKGKLSGIIEMFNAGGNYFRLFYNSTDGLGYWDNTGFKGYYNGSALYEDSDIEIVISVGTTSINYYINGDVVKTVSGTTDLKKFNQLRIGTSNATRGYMDGEFDLVEFYDYALSANEVKLLHEEELHTSVSNQAGYGEEQVTNGDFDTDTDWSFGAGWSYDSVNKRASCDSSNVTSSGIIFQDISLSNIASGNRVKVTFNVPTADSGTEIYLYNPLTSSYDVYSITQGEQFSGEIYSNGSYDNLVIRAKTLNNNFSIDNVSVKGVLGAELTPILEYDFVKNKSAYNKVEYGDEQAANPNFEGFTAGVANNWTPTLNATYQGTYSEDTNGQRIDLDNERFALLDSEINVKTGDHFKYYVRVFASTTLTLRIDLSGRPETAQTLNLTSGWNVFEGTFISTGTSSSYIEIFSTINQTGYVIIDTYSVKLINNENQSLADCTFGQQGLIANGLTTKLDTGSTADLTGDITVEAIINPASYGEIGAGRIIDNGKIIFHVWLTDNRLYFTSDGTGGDAVSAINSILLNDKPKYCIATRTSTGVVNFYINGKLSGTANQPSGTLLPGTTNIIIGNNNDVARTFDGAIKVVNVYSGIMTSEQITKRYNYWIDRGYVKR